MNKEREKEIAEEILRQLGGKFFIVMTGAMDFEVVDGGGLAFKLPHFAKDGINSVSIKLEDTDTYTVRFRTIKGAVQKEEVIEDVYNEDLESLFTEHTGLATRL